MPILRIIKNKVPSIVNHIKDLDIEILNNDGEVIIKNSEIANVECGFSLDKTSRVKIEILLDDIIVETKEN